MTAASLVGYALALVLAVATPGPAMIALVARSLARGAGPGLRMAFGIALADVLLGTLALLGLAALLATYAWAVTMLKYAAAAYLLWLGVRMWRSSPIQSQAAAPAAGGDVAAGLAVGLSNPKAMLFHASLMPLIVDLRELDARSAAIILAIIFFANFGVMSAYAVLAGRGSGWFRTPARARWLNILGGGSMIGAGAIVAAH
jgi:threonine/homoserine/homoserine lactone efflux protein